MQVSSRQYAQALFALTKDASRKEADKIITALVKDLARQNALSRAAQIIAAFEKLYNQKHGVVRAEVVTARPLSVSARTDVEKAVVEKFSARVVELAEIVDAGMQGGLKIKVGDEMFDGTVARILSRLRNKLV